MGRIFISHQNNHADNAWAAKVHAWIKDQKGIRGFLDFDIEDGIKAGEEWEKKIYAAMNAAQVVIAIVSKDWLESSWCMSEARMARLLGRKLILIITETCEVPFNATQSIMLEKHGEERAFEELRQALQTTHNPPARPYPGLATFAQEDAAVFFGREDETKKLENQLESLFEGRPETERLLLLLGASGSGKSSLMRAGLLPGFEERKTHHAIRPIIPRGDALGELAVALGIGPLGPGTTDDAARKVLDQIAEHAPGCESILLPIDQAEELLRGDQSRFFDVLKVVLERGNGRIIALMTMRSDFLNAFQQSGLIGAGTPLPYATYTLDPLPQNRLPDIIQKPAEIYGVTFEEGLVARIMADHGGPDALPLLAFFLSEFWTPQYIKDGRLEIPEYEHSGGIDGALTGAVDESIKRCAKVMPEETDARKLLNELREIFLGYLVGISAGSGDPVRRRAAADTLTERQVGLLKEFARKRLLIERDGSWEVTHEALLRQWEDLKTWIDAAREDLVAIDRIEAAAAQWDDAGRREEDLTHSGSRLSEALGMLDSPLYADRLDETARLYLTACQQKETELYEKEKQLREDAQRERDRARAGESRARRFTRLAATVALVALVASGFAYLQWGEARERRAEAVKNQRLGFAALSSSELMGGRPAEAVQLALAAWPRRADPRDDLSDYSVALDALSAASAEQQEVLRVEAHSLRIASVAFSPDGTKIVTGSDDRTLRLWDARTGDPIGAPMTGQEGPIWSVAFSPDGTRIVSVSKVGFIAYWDAKTGNPVGEGIPVYEFGATGLAISPDGMRLVSGDMVDNALRIWDMQTGAQIGAPMTGHEARILSIAFSRDGSRIVSGDAVGRLHLWDAQTGDLIAAPLAEYEGAVSSVAFSSDGRRIVSIDENSVVRHWNTETGDPMGMPIAGHKNRFRSHAFSPDGRQIATGSNNGTLRVWDMPGGTPIDVPTLDFNSEASFAVSPDGARLVGAGWDGTVRFWSAKTGARILQPIVEHESTFTSVAFSPNGTRIVTGSEDKTIRIWNARTGDPIGAPLTGHRSAIRSVAFSPNGQQVVSTSAGVLRIWDARTGSPIGNPIGRPIGARVDWSLPMDNVSSFALSQDSKRIATGHVNGVIQLWDLQTGDPMGAPMTEHEFSINSVAFSPDGQKLVSGDNAGVLQIRDLQTGGLIGLAKEAHGDPVSSVAFSPDGTQIISAYFSGKLQLWDAQTGARIGAPMIGHEGSVSSVAFSPEGTRLVSGGWDGMLNLWDLSTRRVMLRMEGYRPGAQRGGITSVTFSPDGTQVISSGGGGELRLWDVDYAPGNLFEFVCRRLPTKTPPAILASYGIELDEPICSGKEPLPIPLPQEQLK